MSKTALVAPRGGTLFLLRPEVLTLVVDPAHYLYDERVDLPLDPEVLANIDAEGVRVPIFVVKEGEDTLVVAGRQRRKYALEVNKLRAAAGKEPLLLPAICLRGAKEQILKVAILENEARAEDTPLGKAKKVKRYMDLRHSDQPIISEADLKREAASLFAVTTKTIEARLKLLDLAPSVQAAVEEKKIGVWAATELSTLPVPEQAAAVVEMVKVSENGGKKPSIEDAKRKASKGDSKVREKTQEVKNALLEAAEFYGTARTDDEGIAEAKEGLLAAALDYYKVVSAPKAGKK